MPLRDDPRGSRPKILYVLTEDWFFFTHRLVVARASRAAGYEVVIAAREAAHGEAIRSEGFELVDLPTMRRAFPLWAEPYNIWSLYRLIMKVRPTLIDLVALKPAFFGTIAARLAGKTPVFCTLTGLGFVFTSESVKARILRPFVTMVLRYFLGHPSVNVVVQNREDKALLLRLRLITDERCHIVLGSGVDAARFLPLPPPEGPVTCAVVCRMLGDKGVNDVVEACRILRARGKAVRMLLVGPEDPLNPTAISRVQLNDWQKEGVIEWLGPMADLREVWKRAHIALLPSHREGLPMALLEAAACSRPIITTATTGCAEVVQDGVNGLLVPVKDPASVADSIERLAGDSILRERMGAAGRARVERLFAAPIVAAQTIGLYKRFASVPRSP